MAETKFKKDIAYVYNIFVSSAAVRNFSDGIFISIRMHLEFRDVSYEFYQFSYGHTGIIVIVFASDLGVWSSINLMESYGGDNAASNACRVLCDPAIFGLPPGTFVLYESAKNQALRAAKAVGNMQANVIMRMSIFMEFI